MLILNIHIDEIVFRELASYKNFKFANIETDEEDLSKYLEEVKHDESKGIKSEDLTTFPLWVKNELQPFVNKVVVSKRSITGPGLVSSPMSASMRQIQMMRQLMERGEVSIILIIGYSRSRSHESHLRNKPQSQIDGSAQRH